jgi:hypothetical protein
MMEMTFTEDEVYGPSDDSLISGWGKEMHPDVGVDDLFDKKEAIKQEKALEKQQVKTANSFTVAWRQAFSQYNAGAMAANATTSLLKESWGMVVTAALTGGDLTAANFLRMTQQIGLALAIEGSLKAIAEYAEAAAAAASYNYPAAAQHTTAGAMFTALAVAGAAVAAGSTLGINAVGGGGGGSGGARSGYANGYSGGNSYTGTERPQKVVIVLQGGAEEIFNAVEKRNEKNSRMGRKSFALAGK